LANKSLEDTKRISFDREQRVEITNATEEDVFDPEELDTGWERVYTCVSVVNLNHSMSKIRFGTGDKQKIKWHVEEPAPAVNVYYNTDEEIHARQHNIGVVGIYGATLTDKIVVVWHGYDKRVRER